MLLQVLVFKRKSEFFSELCRWKLLKISFLQPFGYIYESGVQYVFSYVTFL